MTVAWRGYEGTVYLHEIVSSHFVADAGRAVVALSTGSYASQGVTLHFECTVLNGTSSVAVAKVTSPSGIIMSDADGASSDTYYAAGTLSQWLVSCPEMTRCIELNMTSFLGISDELTVVPIRDEVPDLVGSSSFSGLPMHKPHCRCRQDAAATAGSQRRSRLHAALYLYRRLPTPFRSWRPACVPVRRRGSPVPHSTATVTAPHSAVTAA